MAHFQARRMLDPFVLKSSEFVAHRPPIPRNLEYIIGLAVPCRRKWRIGSVSQHHRSQPGSTYEIVMRVYVGNIPSAATQEDLRAVFEHFGTVATVRIVKNRVTGDGKGDGFVDMTSDADAEVAITWLHQTQYGGRTISVGRTPEDARSL